MHWVHSDFVQCVFHKVIGFHRNIVATFYFVIYFLVAIFV